MAYAEPEPEEAGPSAEEDQGAEDQNLQEASPDSPRGSAMRGWRPNPYRVPDRSSLKGGNSTIRRKPQMDPITESSGDQQDSLASEEDLLQVLLTTVQCLALVQQLGSYAEDVSMAVTTAALL